jgi:surfactin synthase thioesterase subunit
VEGHHFYLEDERDRLLAEIAADLGGAGPKRP